MYYYPIISFSENSIYSKFQRTLNFVTDNCIINRTSKIFNSLLGRSLAYSIQENVAESAGFYSLASLAAPVAASAGATLMRAAGQVAGTALSGEAGLAVGTYVYKHSGGSILQTALATAAVAIPLFLTLPDWMAEGGEYMGSQMGSLLGYWAGGIIGGHLAIKWMGSQEKLWDTENFWQGYAVKTLQCAVGSTLLKPLKPALPLAVDAIVDQSTGSMIYNSRDIVKFTQSLMDGRTLDGALPLDLKSKDLFSEKTMLQGVFNPMAALGVSQFLNRLKFEDDLFEQAKDKFLDLLSKNGYLSGGGKYILQNLPPHIEDMPFVQAKDQIMSSLMLKALSPVVDVLVQLQVGKEEVVALYDQLLHLLIKSTNQYLLMIAKDESITKAMADLEQTKDGDHEGEKLNHLNHLIAKKLEEELGDESLLAALVKIGDSDAGQTTFEMCKQLNTGRGFIDGLARHWISQREQYDSIAKELAKLTVTLLRELEEWCIGLALTSDQSEIKIRNAIRIHFPFLMKIMLANAWKGESYHLDEGEMKSFYIHLSRMFMGNYRFLLGDPAAKNIQELLEKQISQGKLYY
jgi:hypothetical protein